MKNLVIHFIFYVTLLHILFLSPISLVRDKVQININAFCFQDHFPTWPVPRLINRFTYA